MPDVNVRVVPIEHEIAENGNGLRESSLNPKLGSIFDQIREDYQKYKIEERMAKAKRKRHYLIGSAFIFLALTDLIMFLQFKGLLSIGSLVEKFKL
jgi:hypothetical protein